MTNSTFTYQSVFDARGGDHLRSPIRSKSKSRKRYTEERRKEVAITRKFGACVVCRKRKVRCTHHPFANTMHTTSNRELRQGNKFENIEASSNIDIDSRDHFNVTSHFSGEVVLGSKNLEGSIEPPQIITAASEIYHKSLSLNIGDNRQSSVDYLANSLPLHGKTLEMEPPKEYSIDNQALDDIIAADTAALGYGNGQSFSFENNEAGCLKLVQTSGNAAGLQDAGPHSFDTWMVSFEPTNLEATSWLGDGTSFLHESSSTMFELDAEMLQTPQNNFLVPGVRSSEFSSDCRLSSQHTSSLIIPTPTRGSVIEGEDIGTVTSSQKFLWE